jgi:O-antigen/teichoic acid export membrane protein
MLNESLLRAREKMHWEAVSNLVQGTILVGGSALALTNGLEMIWIGWAQLAGTLARFAVTVPAVRREIPILWRSAPSAQLLRSALPYAATSITAAAFSQIDVVILSLVASQKLVGEYASVSRLLVGVGAFAITGANTLLPAAARVFVRGSAESFRYVMANAFQLGALIGTAASVALALVGGPILRLVYGEAFGNLELALSTGSIFVAFKTLSSIFGMGLTAAERQATRARCLGIGLDATIVLMAVLVPPFGVRWVRSAPWWGASWFCGRRPSSPAASCWSTGAPPGPRSP